MVDKISPKTALCVEYATTVVAVLFVALRLYVRGWLQARLDAADFFIVVALVCFCTANSFDFASYRLGLWNPDLIIEPTGPPDLRPFFPDDRKLVIMLKILYAEMTTYYSSLFFVKFAFLRIYHDLIPKGTAMTKLRIFLKATTYFTAVGYVVVVLVNLLYCLPVSRNWQLDADTDHRCYSALEPAPYFVAVSLHVVTDLAIYGIPFFILPQLKYFSQSLRGVIAVFSLGFLAIAVTGLRLAFNIEVWIPLLCVWSSAEQCVAIAVVCTPPLKWFIKGFSYAERSNSGSSSKSVAQPEVTDEEKAEEDKTNGSPSEVRPGLFRNWDTVMVE